MIPYIEINPLVIGDKIAIQPFGLLVVAGCTTGLLVARWHARSRGLPLKDFGWLAVWVLVPAFVLSHVVSMGLYFPDALVHAPTRILRIETSMSSFGGFLGGTLGALAYLKRRGLPVLEFSDALVLGLTIGWVFGRLGCTIAHDHPGLHSDFILAVNYPDGPRHDLGFYEWLYTIFLTAVLLWVRSRRPPAGTIVGVACVLYAPVRFMFDFLRVEDTLYLGFTPGQYFAVVLLFVGCWVLWQTIKYHPRDTGGC